MRGFNGTSRTTRALVGKAVLAAALPLVAGVQAANGFGLEQFSVTAAAVSNGLVAATAGEMSKLPGFAVGQPGLVSQDRSRMDLSTLTMSAFGDADEPAAR